MIYRKVKTNEYRASRARLLQHARDKARLRLLTGAAEADDGEGDGMTIARIAHVFQSVLIIKHS
jgi:hypothetical protein